MSTETVDRNKQTEWWVYCRECIILQERFHSSAGRDLFIKKHKEEHPKHTIGPWGYELYYVVHKDEGQKWA